MSAPPKIALQRDAGPPGTVAELVAQFVQRLLQFEQAEQSAARGRRGGRPARPDAPRCRRSPVGGEERVAHLRPPRRVPSGASLGTLGLVVRDAAQRAVLHVAERAQHAGDVAQRRLLGAPLLEAVAGLTLEIDDDEIVARQQHLTEMIIAVDADFVPGRRLGGRGIDAREYPSRGASTAAPCRAPTRQPLEARTEFCERAPGLVGRSLPVGVDVRAASCGCGSNSGRSTAARARGAARPVRDGEHARRSVAR